jgi:RNA polymerase sigma-70 factor (sigma-E family)
MDDLGTEFDDFVRATSPGLLHVAFLLCGDQGHAEDLLQTAFFRTARRWASVQGNPRAYARAALVNLVKDSWRGRGRRPAETALLSGVDDAAVEDGADRVLLRSALLRVVNELPPRQRAVLILRYYEDLPVEEVARLLDCTAAAVKSQTHYARSRLRELIVNDDLELDDAADDCTDDRTDSRTDYKEQIPC